MSELLFLRVLREAPEHILSRLNGEDIHNLSLLCRSVHKMLQDDNLWSLVVTMRFGNGPHFDAFGQNCKTDGPRKEYALLSLQRRFCTRWMRGAWSRNDSYWMVQERGPEPPVLLCDFVWWVEEGIRFPSVLPGYYRVRWQVLGRGKFPFFVTTDRYPLDLTFTEQDIQARHREFGNGTSRLREPELLRWTPRLGRDHDANPILEFPQILMIQWKDDVLTGVYDTFGSVKSHMGYIFAELVPINPASLTATDVIVTQRRRFEDEVVKERCF
eukprot:Protomagalhaensia_wolfi_Nauph_80__1586@NODE_1979_length_1259_cov_88_915574_g1549_i0_p1_GENE_NODE_1979_length_1259_cov_88_915574_g1549_i0NODE_1979_length_1259_cov_88_915574_g1549_i0_p1_ORF_typecomplete_len271_score25_66Fbox/PF00646_33/0_00043Fbox/PF00646_33/5_2e03Fboxlike/PF12937_7/0_012Fboxlike/PF12937_7/2_5e03_NODE_1979_length_1259_cov_88_915574_g1549_i014826